MKMLKKMNLLIVVFMILVLAGCNTNDEQSESVASDTANADSLELGQENLTIPYVPWARESVSTEILAILLEDIGYNVTTSQVEAGVMYSSVADGSADFFTGGKLPHAHANYWDQYEDDLVLTSVALENSPHALTVPSYMEDVNSIEDLVDNEELGESVDWEIVGIDPGSGLMQSTMKVLDEYELEGWEAIQSSEPAMLSVLRSKIANEEPVIVTLWQPHWIFHQEDLKLLDDPKGTYGGDEEKVYTIARADLEQDAPAAFRVIENYSETNEMIEGLMNQVHNEGEEPRKVAENFLADNPDLVEEWTEGIEQ